MKIIVLKGVYAEGWNSASDNWDLDIVPNQGKTFPEIKDMYKGTFNIKLTEPREYVPGDISEIRAKNGNRSCISNLCIVTSINKTPIEAYIYNGGWPSDTIELIANRNISKLLNLKLGDLVTINVSEK